jgi:hypothetical protein
VLRLLTVLALLAGGLALSPSAQAADGEPFAVTGSVTTPSGPGAGALVVAYAGTDPDTGDRAWFASTEADPTGAYRLDLPAGEYELDVVLAGHAARTGIPVQVSGDTVVEGVELTALWRVRGVVRDADGRPVPGVTVFGSSDEPLPSDGSTTTDADGAYDLALGTGTWDLYLVADGYRSRVLEDVVVDADVTGVDATLVRVHAVTGTLASSDGTALVEPWVSFEDATTGELEGAAVGEDGSFLAYLPSGEHTVHARAQGTSELVRLVTVDGDTDLGELVLSSMPAVTGRVVAAVAADLADVCVTLLTTDEQEVTSACDLSATDGTFSLTAEPGEYRVVVRQGNRVVHDRAVVLGDEDVQVGDLPLARVPALTGTLRSGGAPLDGEACVHLYTADGDVVNYTCALTAGAFTLRAPAGTYDLLIDARGHETVQRSVRLGTSGTSIGAVDLVPLAVLRGTLPAATPDAYDAADLRLERRSADGDWWEPAERADVSVDRETGAFTIHTKPGTYRLRVQLAGYVVGYVTDVQLSAAGRDLGAVALTPGVRLTGVVRAPDGTPVESAVVRASVVEEGGVRSLDTETWTDPEGRYTVTVPAGQVELEVVGPGRRFAVATVRTDVPDEPETTFDVELVELPRVTGRVAVPAGASAADVRVELYVRHQGAWMLDDYVYPDADGTYTVHVSAGSWRLGYVLDGHETAWRDVTVAGDQPVVELPVVSLRPALAPTAAPRVRGTARVGVTLSASGVAFTPRPTAISYQWLADGAAIRGATATTFTPGPAQLGRRISVRATAARTGYAGASATSSATARVATGTITVRKAPTVTGTPKVGRTLKASAGGYAPAAVKVGYQWRAGGKAIKGATRSTFRLGRAQAGTRITVTVTVRATGYATRSVTSRATGTVKR